jgi:hypothetical protein
MALNDIEAARVKKVVGDFIHKRRPPRHIRPKLDLGFRVSGQSVEIFEIRPVWRGPAGANHEGAVAKATYVRTRRRWRVFWQRRDLKWHRYEPMPEVASIDEFVALVDEDRHACFFG